MYTLYSGHILVHIEIYQKMHDTDTKKIIENYKRK